MEQKEIPQTPETNKNNMVDLEKFDHVGTISIKERDISIWKDKEIGTTNITTVDGKLITTKEILELAEKKPDDINVFEIDDKQNLFIHGDNTLVLSKDDRMSQEYLEGRKSTDKLIAKIQEKREQNPKI